MEMKVRLTFACMNLKKARKDETENRTFKAFKRNVIRIWNSDK